MERLCHTGSRGMGALEYAPATRLAAPGIARIEVDWLVELASKVLSHRHNPQAWLDGEGSTTPGDSPGRYFGGWGAGQGVGRLESADRRSPLRVGKGGQRFGHQMTMNGKWDRFAPADFRACARSASMKRGRAATILDEVRAVVGRWPDYADQSRVKPEQRDRSRVALRLAL